MQRRSIRRALVAASTLVILAAVGACADTVPADGDAVTPGNQSLVVLPDATPGQVVTWPINFRLTCDGLNHAAPGATIQLDLDSATVPLGGDASATSTSIGPVPADWALDGCASPAPTIAANGPSVVTLTMPPTAGGYEFTIFWSRLGATGLTGSSVITFQVNVVGNTPPTLHLPSGILAEATSPAGAAVKWSATATDAEDATPPTPTCSPASGSTFPLGITTVHCSVTDGGGLKDSGSFLVTVEDTTVPKLVGMPADQNLTTGDPAGTTVTFTPPTATDTADPSPTVGCVPASGSHVAVGTTTVTCTAQDATGNHVSATFAVNVTYVPSIVWSATWGEPVGSSGATFVANAGRTVPVKVEMFADGVEQTHGVAVLTLATCAGTGAGTVGLSWDGGRWAGHLDTSMLGGPGCYVATASLDGNVAGSFRIDLRGADPAVTTGGPKGRAKG
ncbi:MAG TPA: HYR domain-containing protein [Candidatus Limnocylindrales bacterium]|nr:HYR domain-containing protein [Candidatus Limnocylindrales bacterium]